MRVLLVNSKVNFGSTGRICEEIGGLLIDNNHESYIAYGRGIGISKSKLIKIGANVDVFMHGLKTLFTDRHGFGSLLATRKFIQKIKKVKPDIIHLHNTHGYYLNIEVLFNYIKQNTLPLIWTFHDSWAYTGHCTFYDSISCVKWQSECERCPKIHNYPKSLFFDQSNRNFKNKVSLYGNLNNMFIVTPSNWLKKEVKESFLRNQSTRVIHNGIDLSAFKPCLNQVIKRKIVLGVASTWDYRKGLADFIELAKLLPRNMQIVLIGLSSKQISSLPTNIKGIKRTENLDELVMWYNKAMVFLNPTWQDNFPTTNLEALACGTPVITYNTGGSPEALDEKTGFVVEKGDINGVLQAIEKIEVLGKEHFSKNCRQRAELLFNKDDRYNDYINLYEEVLAVDV